MFLKHVPSGDLIEVLDLPDVINPHSATVRARAYTGDIVQRAENFLKTELAFPSGEPLPLCWVDGHYREHVAAA
ncbi:MAG: hypothetical protein K9M54_06400 [Kiritimatiellales bacterium]|nr:hypothetical protein [Kiritimatiellales bacterium]MCF7863460.1 hypothetical protein [Kiritimatiellales bacterium]